MTKKLLWVIFSALSISCGSASSSSIDTSQLVELSTFVMNPSSSFLVDLSLVSRTSPFVGENNDSPHDGAHVHFDDNENYPEGSTLETYPAIFAVADGIISQVDDNEDVGENTKYSILLAFAQDDGESVEFEYSIEPMTNPDSNDFYKTFILVSAGDTVAAGDIIARMYVPETGEGTHIHFSIRNSSHGKQAPAIFSADILDYFTALLEEGGSCMGVNLNADQNPQGTGATECL